MGETCSLDNFFVHMIQDVGFIFPTIRKLFWLSTIFVYPSLILASHDTAKVAFISRMMNLPFRKRNDAYVCTPFGAI